MRVPVLTLTQPKGRSFAVQTTAPLAGGREEGPTDVAGRCDVRLPALEHARHLAVGPDVFADQGADPGACVAPILRDPVAGWRQHTSSNRDWNQPPQAARNRRRVNAS